MQNTVLVTGGTGYIGSHTVIELLNNDYKVIIVDNLSNSSHVVLERIVKLTGKEVEFYQIDILNCMALESVFARHKIDAVIHFAALKAVGESVIKPLEYYQNNISGSITLLQTMSKFAVKTLVFSSSATVYGEPHTTPITEDFATSATNPYGASKLFVEQMLGDVFKADNNWSIARLRYFNPVGAHKSGLIGEDPNGIPNNLMPYIAQVAVGKRAYLSIFGNDYATYDGTGVRDYIHVVDLAIGHIKALQYFSRYPKSLLTVNLGTGIGYSVLDVVKAFARASGKKIDYKFAPRRAGDVAKCYTDPSLAYTLFGFKTRYTLDEMCRDSWNFQLKNPNGYIKS